MNNLFYALGTEERINLLSLLLASDSAVTVQSLANDNNRIHQPTIRYHLDVLHNAGLLFVSRTGNVTTYEVRHREQVKTLLAAATVIAGR